ncbi:hypothetical protein [Hymenobacter metallilatus]|uniref:Lipoprotein n=1 Tax=Hymenobacter metallilatus TaxID=2493666 RepID=A0A428JKF6_9BACT|nr:hypothetical protein [Hymenobacter metallilatus]RSK33259.1 hypothetical protein EI290_11155 [Hymenobacter metallilatus]
MKKTFVLYLLIFALAASCQNKDVDSQTHQRAEVEKPMPKLPPALLKPKGKAREYVVLPFSEKHTHSLIGATPSTLTEKEISQVYALVQKAIAEYNASDTFKGEFRGANDPIDIVNYRLQLIPGISAVGEKIVWVQGFCSDMHTDWKTTRLQVHDGGNCYFRVDINLSRKKRIRFTVNGEA